ncbi:MAG: hypothetical protein M0040_04545 [Actinomycetota bacterium]|nr:hypothetical protein [Actinomycetota bacterium]
MASTRTVVATSVVGGAVGEGEEEEDDELLVGGAATAVTQAPTTTADEAAGTVWVKVVAVVYVTVVWPLRGFWTSMDWPATAAIVPDTPGGAVGVRVADDGAVCAVEADAVVDEPQAATTMAMVPRAPTTAAVRRRFR